MKDFLKKVFQNFDRAICFLENIGTGTTFLGIVVIVSINIFYRYVLKSGIMWASEIQEVLVVAMTMFGCAKATREAGHTELTSIIKMLPRVGRISVRALTSVAALVFLVVFFVASVKYTLSTGNLRTIILRIPYCYFYMFLPIGMGLNIYEFVKRIPARIMQDPPEEF